MVKFDRSYMYDKKSPTALWHKIEDTVSVDGMIVGNDSFELIKKDLKRIFGQNLKITGKMFFSRKKEPPIKDKIKAMRAFLNKYYDEEEVSFQINGNSKHKEVSLIYNRLNDKFKKSNQTRNNNESI